MPFDDGQPDSDLAEVQGREEPYVRTKAADQILGSIGNYCNPIDDSGH